MYASGGVAARWHSAGATPGQQQVHWEDVARWAQVQRSPAAARARARPYARQFSEDAVATQLATRIVEACLPCIHGPSHVIDDSGARDSSGAATVGALGALASSGAPSGSAVVALLARVCEVMGSLAGAPSLVAPCVYGAVGAHGSFDPPLRSSTRAYQVLHSDDTAQPRNAYPSALTLSPRWVEARTRCAGARVSVPHSREALRPCLSHRHSAPARAYFRQPLQSARDPRGRAVEIVGRAERGRAHAVAPHALSTLGRWRS